MNFGRVRYFPPNRVNLISSPNEINSSELIEFGPYERNCYSTRIAAFIRTDRKDGEWYEFCRYRVGFSSTWCIVVTDEDIVVACLRRRDYNILILAAGIRVLVVETAAADDIAVADIHL